MAKHIGLFGGSFNPVHRGHLLVVKSVFANLQLDALRFIPAAQSPLKAKPQIEDTHRLAMLELAIKGEPGLSIDARELHRSGPSYTIDTLRGIAKETPKDHLYLIIGMDAWLDFEQWRDWQKIIKLCRLIVMTRPAYKSPTLSAYWRSRQVEKVAQLRDGKFMLLPVPASDASSTEIRRILAAGQDVSHFLDPEVEHYIAENQLYK